MIKTKVGAERLAPKSGDKNEHETVHNTVEIQDITLDPQETLHTELEIKVNDKKKVQAKGLA